MTPNTIKANDGKTKIALPDGITTADLLRRDYENPIERAPEGLPYEDHDLELWYTPRFGWCIPTLDISNSRRGMPRRTYGVAIGGTRDGKRGAVVTMGNGPHVLATVRVYVRKCNVARVTPFLELRREGQGSAGSIRDRISTRRAQGQVHRALGHTSWRW